MKPWARDEKRFQAVLQRAYRLKAGGFENPPREYYMRPGRARLWSEYATLLRDVFAAVQSSDSKQA